MPTAIIFVHHYNNLLLGVGTDGHIAVNEPGSSLGSRTRAVSMSAEMMEYVTSIFSREGSTVPTQILTVGMGTIMDAREVSVHSKQKVSHT